jgi:regulator of protease activity HflC (stomatin/prohibitin superfamily)
MNIFIIILLIIVVIIILSGIKIVQQQKLMVIERLGKFNRILQPGLNLTIPIFEQVAFVLNLRTQNLDFSIMAITSDKVTITLDTALIYKVIPEQGYAVAYNLQRPIEVIKTTVENSIRAYVAQQTHEEILEKRDELTLYLVEHLRELMLGWGYEISNFQVKDVILPQQITSAMSQVVASKRLQEAAQNEANAEYIKLVKNAEAQKESRILQGEGLAGERKAIINGLAESIHELSTVAGTKPEAVMNVVMLNQYIDMLRTISKDDKGNSKVVFLSSNPSGMTQAMQEMSELIK